jgi:hypothetical protein
MRTWLTHNFGLKVVSVLLAAILWWVIQVRSGALRGDAPADEVPSGPLR